MLRRPRQLKIRQAELDQLQHDLYEALRLRVVYSHARREAHLKVTNADGSAETLPAAAAPRQPGFAGLLCTPARLPRMGLGLTSGSPLAAWSLKPGSICSSCGHCHEMERLAAHVVFRRHVVPLTAPGHERRRASCWAVPVCSPSSSGAGLCAPAGRSTGERRAVKAAVDSSGLRALAFVTPARSGGSEYLVG
jgi:hypothetical protein